MTPDLIAVGEDRWELGDLVFDLARWEVLRGGEDLDVTAVQFQILARLVRAGGRPVPVSELFREMWDWESDGESAAVRMHISRLRRRIGPDVIRTVPGVGYAIRCSWSAPAQPERVQQIAELARGFLQALEAAAA